MPTLRFDAWMNALNGNDPGHMAMLDERGGYYYEFAMGPALDAQSPDNKHVPKQVKVTDTMTGQSRTTVTKQLTFYRSPKDEYFRRQLMKCPPNSTTFRFTHLFYIEVDVTEPEYRELMIKAFVRGAGGTYNMMKEGQVAHPLVTRCLTLLEDLAQIRGARLARGTALQLLLSFQQHFPHVQVREDPLIAY